MIVFVAFLSISFEQIGNVKADDYVFIRENGRIEGTNKIDRVGNVYTFTDDIFEFEYDKNGNITKFRKKITESDLENMQYEKLEHNKKSVANWG